MRKKAQIHAFEKNTVHWVWKYIKIGQVCNDALFLLRNAKKCKRKLDNWFGLLY